MNREAIMVGWMQQTNQPKKSSWKLFYANYHFQSPNFSCTKLKAAIMAVSTLRTLGPKAME